jgi:hypothetical protein
VPSLARWLLSLGIVATLAANVAHGLGRGIFGAAVGAWPAVALVGSYELLLMIVRSEQTPARCLFSLGPVVTLAANVAQRPWSRHHRRRGDRVADGRARWLPQSAREHAMTCSATVRPKIWHAFGTVSRPGMRCRQQC